jgi:hypothetical protein
MSNSVTKNSVVFFAVLYKADVTSSVTKNYLALRTVEQLTPQNSTMVVTEGD